MPHLITHLIQLQPVFGAVESNQRLAEQLIRSNWMKQSMGRYICIDNDRNDNADVVDDDITITASAHDVRVIVLSEMAFTGYTFHSPAHVFPFCEEVSLPSRPSPQYSNNDTTSCDDNNNDNENNTSGSDGNTTSELIIEANDNSNIIVDRSSTLSWCQSIAKNYHSYVIVGFPQKIPSNLSIDDLKQKGCHPYRPANDNDASKSNTPIYLLYNSLMVVSPQGHLLRLYQKKHLYVTDEAWATEGPSFLSFPMEIFSNLSYNLGVGICMDINPYQFKSSYDLCEFASYHRGANSEIIICCMNWVDSRVNIDDKTKGIPSIETLEYWCSRFMPLLQPCSSGFSRNTSKGAHDSSQLTKYIIICNRIGEEETTQFVGSSCVLKLKNGKFKLMGALSSGYEGALVLRLHLDQVK